MRMDNRGEIFTRNINDAVIIGGVSGKYSGWERKSKNHRSDYRQTPHNWVLGNCKKKKWGDEEKPRKDSLSAYGGNEKPSMACGFGKQMKKLILL